MGNILLFYPHSPTTFIYLWERYCNVKVDIDPSELVEKTADNRGRITLGSEYANQKVKVLVLND